MELQHSSDQSRLNSCVPYLSGHLRSDSIRCHPSTYGIQTTLTTDAQIYDIFCSFGCKEKLGNVRLNAFMV
jgi:hypothetical protein